MGHLTASIAHEVTHPISAMVADANAALNWLGRQPPDLEEARQSLTYINQNGRRAAEIVNRVRDLLKKAPPRQDWLDINAVIRDLIDLIRTETLKNSVYVKTELAHGLPAIRGDGVQLQQVILNLMVNAVEAMSETSEGFRELRVGTAQTPAGDLLVEVRDSDPGLPPDKIDRLFEAFLHNQTWWLGNRALDLPFDCRSAWWAIVGERECTPRRHLSLHAARSAGHCIVSTDRRTLVSLISLSI